MSKDDICIGDWFIHSIFTDERIIYLDGMRNDDGNMVTDVMVSRFIKAMVYFEHLNHNAILVIINTDGGDAYDAFAIYDRIKSSPCVVTVRGYGKVMSGGSVIMQAGDVRELSPNSYFMVHDGTETVVDASNQTVMAYAKNGVEMRKNTYSIFQERMLKKDPDITIKKIEKMFQNDYIVNAKKAVELGMIDKIYDGEEE